MPPEDAAVTVIVPAYRAATTIGRALAGVAAQTVRPRQVVVVDDGSDDGTAEAAEACAGDLDGIALEVLRQPHAGAGAARNRALLAAHQPIVAFLDADDEWLPAHLERSLFHLDAGDHVLVAHNGWQVDGGDESLIDGARRFAEGADPFVSLYRKGYIDTCTVVARRDAVVAAGGFDPELPNAQDFDLWLAMLRRPGTRFLIFDEPLSRYHVARHGIMSHTRRRLDCCLRIAARYAADLRRRPGSPLASLWFRVVAVHHEAISAQRARGEWAAALGTVFRLPFSLIAMTTGYLIGRTPPRRGGIGAEAASEDLEATADGALVYALAWLWVVGVFAAYLWQFRDLVDPLLALLGGA
jgi:glycosyltransferase involved in cell wall biosynthesis